MFKRVLFVLSLFSLFLLISCSNLVESNYGRDDISFSLGEKTAESISRAVTANEEITTDTNLKILCELLRGETVLKEEVSVVALKDLCNASFSFNNIQHGNRYFISLKIYYKDFLIYSALSDRIQLNDDNSHPVITLQLQQNNSKITYVLNDGQFKNGLKGPDEYCINSDIKLPKPERAKFQFAGWYDNSEFTGEKVTDLGRKKFVGDVTLYAKWNEFGVTFEPDIDSLDFGDEIKLSCSMEGSKIYYTTDGSEPTEASTPYIEGAFKVDSKVIEKGDSFTVKAVAVKDGEKSQMFSKNYTMKRYSVIYNKNGFGTEDCPTVSNCKKNDTVTLTSLSQGIMIFNGWQLGDRLYKPGETVTVTGNLVFNASWQGVVEAVTFSPVTLSRVDVGDKLELNCVTPDSTIYYCIGNGEPNIEYKGPITVDLKNLENLSDSSSETMTIKAAAVRPGWNKSDVTSAEYSIKQYKVQYDYNGKNVEPELTQVWFAKTTKLVQPADPTFAGFEFGGWYKTSACADGELWNFDTDTITKDTILYAKWTDVAPNPVTGATASISNEVDNKGIKLEWTNPADNDLSKILIALEGDTYTQEYTTTLTPSTAVSCVIKDFPANKGNYKFKITAIDGNSDIGKNKSTVTYANINLPAFTNVPAIYNWDKEIGKTGYELKITGSNFQTSGVNISGRMEDKSQSSAGTVNVNVVDDSNLTVIFNIPKGVNDYTVYLDGFGCGTSKTFSVGKFSFGDAVMSDGMLVPSGEAVEYFKTKPASQTAIAVIFRPETRSPEGAVTAPALGIAMDQSEQEFMWAPENSTGAKTAFSTSVDDGSGNWDVIKTADSSGANNAQTNYPAFYWANNYGKSFRSPYNTGWYIPSENEIGDGVGCLKNKKEELDKIVTAINGTSIINTYWSSSSDSASGAFLQNMNGFGMSGWDKWNTGSVRCIRKF